jgi:hypothetical protein
MVLYGCETWSLILKEEHSLIVFDKRVSDKRALRRIFGQKRELHDLYSSSRIIRIIKLKRIKWEVHVAGMGGGESE